MTCRFLKLPRLATCDGTEGVCCGPWRSASLDNQWLYQFAQAREALTGNLLGAFVFVHEGIGTADLLLEIMRAGDLHDPQAHGKRIAAAGILVASPDQLKQTFANQKIACFSALRKQDAEFVPAKPANDIGFTEALPQQCGDLLERIIAFAVAKIVVDVLEIIHVDENQRGAHTLTRSQLQALLGQADEASAIVQTSQFIEKREAAQL